MFMFIVTSFSQAKSCTQDYNTLNVLTLGITVTKSA